jgi:hypothetical protein
MDRRVAYPDGIRLVSDTFVPDVDVIIPGGQIESSTPAQCDVVAAAGIVKERAIAKS